LVVCSLFGNPNNLLNNFSWISVALDTAIQLVQMYESNYPESLRRVFVINAPKILPILWSMVIPFMHQRTRDKIQVYGHDSKQWKAALLADIDPDQLPVCYGGTLTDLDGNPNCITKAINFEVTNLNC
jgi:hypothetical protein